jgi:hypothetical protein
MKYSAGLISKILLVLRIKKTAQYMLEGLSRKEIVTLAINDNIYQVDSEYRSKTIANAIYTRLNSLPDEILKAIVNSDITTSKILVLISIMKTDRLFFEFMHEVFRNKVILGENSLLDRDINIFFDGKKAQSEVVDKWVDSTIYKLKKMYIQILLEAGILRIESGKRVILPPFLDYRIKQILLDNDLAPFLYAATGEK